MKNHTPILFIYVAIILFACNKPHNSNNVINKIEIATGGCLRNCPVVGLIIDSTLNMQYYGGYKATLQGYYHGTVTPGYWDTLNIKLKQINFKTLDTINGLPLDGESAEAIFYWGANKRHVFVPIDSNTAPAAGVFTWIMNSYKRTDLQKMGNNAQFETTFQFIKPPSPPLPADRVLFPPPKKNKRY